MNDLTVVRGDTSNFQITITDSNGLAYDLTDASIWFTVDGLLEKTIGDGITVSTPASGVADVEISAGDTDAAPDRRTAYPYDVQVTLADGSVKTPVRGLFIVLPDVAPA